MMERKLTNLFDRQRFQPNAKLNSVIQDVEGRYGDALDDNDLELVSAAGDSTIPTVNVDVLLGRHDIPADKEQRTW